MREITVSIVFGKTYSNDDPIHLEIFVKTFKVDRPKSESLIRCQLEAIIMADNWANHSLQEADEVGFPYTLHLGDFRNTDGKITNIIAWEFIPIKEGPNVPFYIDRRVELIRVETKGNIFSGMKEAKNRMNVTSSKGKENGIEWVIW